MVAEPLRPARSRNAVARHAPRAPLVVVDAAGIEVGVFVDWPEYVDLLALLASPARRPALPRYWRRALDDCPAAAIGPPRGR